MKTDVFKLRKIAYAVLESKMGNREISRTFGVSSSSVTRYTREVKASGLSWKELDKLNDDAFLAAIKPKAAVKFLQPDFEKIYNFKLSHKRLTLEKVFDYCYYDTTPKQGMRFYSYQHLYSLFDQWLMEHHGKAKISSIPCNPGDYLEIDMVGDPLHWIDSTGRQYELRVFVAALRYSGLFYAEAFLDETLTSWLKGTVHALHKFGIPLALSCDNAKALVKQPHKYMAELSTAMKQLCAYYNMEAYVSQSHSPSQKSETERAAGICERDIFTELEGASKWMYAHDLNQVNEKISALVDIRNGRSFTKNSLSSRTTVYEQQEKPKLRQAPLIPFEMYQWLILKADRYAKVKLSQDNKRYLVEYTQANKEVVCALTDTQVIFYSKKDHRLVGKYKRDYSPEYKLIQDESLMSPADKAFRRGYEAFMEEFNSHGYALPNILKYLNLIYNPAESENGAQSQENQLARNPQMVLYRKSMGLLGLCKKHGAKIVEQACTIAISHGRADDYEFIKNCIRSEIRDINENKRAKKEQRAKQSSESSTSSASSSDVMSRDANYYN